MMENAMDTEIPDGKLIQAYLGGDDGAFETLYSRYRERLYWYLNGLSDRDRAETDDLFQETWRRAVDRLGKYRDDGFFCAWLFRIGRNLAIDRARSRKRAGEKVNIDDENVPELPDKSPNEPWRALDNRTLGGRIEAAMTELSPEQREVFELRVQEMSFRDIAALQNCSINTALGRMQYALKKLRLRLASERV